ncbi:2-oxo acid dehydrogenase subunit E2 [Massilia forsythiae]|uniref:Dihydrolipoamide acetyltransferase component of pyruvate dehydrogenase complex n=1 Tax=Massilia forsythiae TaxID=2728020 RepID=A0A7Z2W0J2_9BURK|nr:dihydrolipoamide acetyltransferase family protein [Massilia forsythiae]QJE02210.1 2-oxo acid dehydrogenase subunit E2 [Massilia forsythiae]
MGIHLIKMPDLGEGIAEVEVVAWRVQPGDAVTEDQILADVMTDKATVEIPSPVHGTVAALGGKVGESLAVGAELIRLEVEGAGNVAANHAAAGAAHAAAAEPASPADLGPDRVGPDMGARAAAPAGATDKGAAAGARSGAAAQDRPATAGSGAAGTGSGAAGAPGASGRQAPGAGKPASAPAHPARAVAANATQQRRPALRAEGDKPLAAPAVRKRAWDLGIELQYVAGSGPAGRIGHADLDAYIAGGAHGHAAGSADERYAQRDGEEAVPVIGLRRKIAEKMQHAKRQIPHFTYVEEIDVTELEALRVQLNARYGNERARLTLLPLIMRAVVLAVRRFPEVNARYDDSEGGGVVTRHQAVHIGVAAQTDAGLMVPVVRHAEARDPWSSAEEIARLAEAARTGKAARDELSGSTITITSLGALGGIVSTPVINHPEVAIVGVNRIVERPVVKNGGMVARKMMNLSSSFDHRVIDGMVAAEFIQTVRGYLECPATLFIE